MNTQECDVLKSIAAGFFTNQRHLAEACGHSLGTVNKCIKELTAEGYLNPDVSLTKKAKLFLNCHRPKNAIILAAGFGMRMVPINLSVPKGLLEVNGEPLIERTIKQLHDVGITDITIVVGFMKERFDYLIDEYGVSLIVNSEYASKNNLSSLALAAERISNTYVIPSDIWCAKNLFDGCELYSWYMLSDAADEDSDVYLNRKHEIVKNVDGESGNRMIGIAYIDAADAPAVREALAASSSNRKNDECFWESAVFSGKKMLFSGRLVPSSTVKEINTFEELRELDGGSSSLRSDALSAIAAAFGTDPDKISNITVLKKGMTNRSFLFHINNRKYIMRIPGEGTDQLIDRVHEAAVFRAIRGRGLCDDPVYIDPSNGYKITEFLEGVRTCDPESVPDLERCMDKLRTFHEMELTVSHEFDIFGQIEFYERLWNGQKSIYKDYEHTKAQVLELKNFIDSCPKRRCLTHIDAVPDNFLFYSDGNGGEALQLTDWEYAGMQDPHVDIAMFCIYSLYGKEQTDRLIDIYFKQNCPRRTRAKIYAYVACCGLLWSNWCEFKRNLGVEFGEYSMRQYRYAKDYYKYTLSEIDALSLEEE